MKPYGNHILYVDNTSHLCVLFFKHVNTAMVKKKYKHLSMVTNSCFLSISQ